MKEATAPQRRRAATKPAATPKRRTQFDREAQPLFLVLGGEVTDPRGARFAKPDALDVRGVFARYEDAFAAWRGAAQETVDNALIKYVIVRLR